MQRLTAVVLLDAVNERAMHVASGDLPVEFTQRDNFESIASKLVGALGDRWRREGWQDVRRLHRVRNLAQHEGLAADRDLLPAWAAATGLFTRSLIGVVYDVNLDDVTLADAIDDQPIADLIRRAELKLGDEDPKGAIEAAWAAFELGRTTWLQGRPMAQAHAMNNLHRAGMQGDRLFKDIEEELQGLRDAAAVEAFATEPAEYLWFRSISYRHRVTPPTLGDAQRAVAFAFWWLVRWEAFRATYVPDRRDLHLRSQRRVRTSATRARIGEVTVRARHVEGFHDVRFALVDVPDDDAFPLWSDALKKRLVDAVGEKNAYVELDGSVGVVVANDANPDAVTAAVDEALAAVEQDVIDAQRAAAVAAAAEQEADQEYRQTLQPVHLPPWVLDVGISYDGVNGPREACILLRLARSPAPAKLHEFIRKHPDVTMCYLGLRGTAVLPVLPAERLAEVLWEAERALRPELDEKAAETAARDRAVQERAAAFSAALLRLPPSPGS